MACACSGKDCGSLCEGACKGTCDGLCSGCSGSCSGCTGCSGTCSNTCTSCTGTCSGNCDNGCTATSMSEIYENLGLNIVLNKILKISDINEIEEAIIRELNRRSKISTTSKSEPETIIKNDIRINIHNDYVTVGYTTSENLKEEVVVSAEQIQRYIAFIKELYGQNLAT